MSTLQNKIRKRRRSRIKSICTVCKLFLLVVGITAVFVGIFSWVAVYNHAVSKEVFIFVSDTLLVATYALIGMGAYIIGMTIIGVYGVWKNSKCALFTNFFLILLVLIISIAFTTMAIVFVFQMKRDLTLTLRGSILQSYGTNGEDKVTLAIDKLQVYFQCCGEFNYTQWLYSQWYEDEKIKYYSSEERKHYPKSCCTVDPEEIRMISNDGISPRLVNESACYVDIPNKFMNNKGCFGIIYEWLYPYILIFGGIGGVIIIILLADLLGFIILVRYLDFDAKDYNKDKDTDKMRHVDMELPPLENYNDMSMDIRKSAVPDIDFTMARKL
ncbi:CD151 antigen-like [Saccoglossus kowalevskii]|uniref:CD151 antigen-like n=1 Tax=Saccoglossus kowalevskii TaxID=10224 RepID=A0ABM0LZ60_SACKO|nr:PREDICTED: CD151 antigen-like [Saccoglossus kowalevskii]